MLVKFFYCLLSTFHLLFFYFIVQGMTAVRMFQFQFHTGFISPLNSTFILNKYTRINYTYTCMCMQPCTSCYVQCFPMYFALFYSLDLSGQDMALYEVKKECLITFYSIHVYAHGLCTYINGQVKDHFSIY